MIIYAVNVNTGGGKVLLDRLLIQNPFEPTSAAFLDARYSSPEKYTGKKFSFTVYTRLLAEKKLHAEIKSSSTKEPVLFFGNLPPIFKPKVTAYLYLQNCYLTGQVPFPKDSFRELLRNFAESWILKLFYRNVSEIWVQTDWMKSLTLKHCPKATVKIKPFLPILPQAAPKQNKTYQFTYVGSLSTNKGLSVFLTALQDLDKSLTSKIGVCVILNNTATEGKALEEHANNFRNISIDIQCKLSREELFNIYESTKYLVVTSLYESYYLPIYEAAHFGCKIIAPNNVGYTSHLPIKDVSYFQLPHLNLRSFV